MSCCAPCELHFFMQSFTGTRFCQHSRGLRLRKSVSLLAFRSKLERTRHITDCQMQFDVQVFSSSLVLRYNSWRRQCRASVNMTHTNEWGGRVGQLNSTRAYRYIQKYWH